MYAKSLILFATLTLAIGCDDAPPRSTGEGEGEGEGPLADAGAIDAADVPVEKAEKIPDFGPFQVVFYYPRRARNDDPAEFDEFVTQQPVTPDNVRTWDEQGADRSVLRNLTDGHIACASCLFSSDGKFVAWAEMDPGTGDQELFVAEVDPGWSIRLDRRTQIAAPGDSSRLDTKSLCFAGDWLVYGIAAGQRLDVRSQRADGTGDHIIQALNLGGGFFCDDAGSTVITLEKQGLASMTTHSVSSVGEPSPQLLHLFEVQGAGTGSDYTGTEPGAVSPDGKYVALFTTARDREGVEPDFKIHTLLTDPRDPGQAHISDKRLGPTGRRQCDVVRAPFEYTRSDDPPVWAPDGRSLYVLGKTRTGCRNDYKVEDTGVLRIEVAANGTLGDLTPITQQRVEYDWPRRVAIHEMVLHPSGDVLVLTATPADRVTGKELFVMSTRADEVYSEFLAENEQATLFSVMVRLTRNSQHDARHPRIFPLR